MHPKISSRFLKNPRMIEITTGSAVGPVDQLPSDTELWIMSEMETWMKLATLEKCSMPKVNPNIKTAVAPKTVTRKCMLNNLAAAAPIKRYKGIKLLVPKKFPNPIYLLRIVIK